MEGNNQLVLVSDLQRPFASTAAAKPLKYNNFRSLKWMAVCSRLKCMPCISGKGPTIPNSLRVLVKTPQSCPETPRNIYSIQPPDQYVC